MIWIVLTVLLAIPYQTQGILKIFLEKGKGDIIRCEASKVLKIEKASFGDGSKCHARNSLSEVQRRCQGYQSCFLAAKSMIFGEPCRGIVKKLFIDYTCVQPGEYDVKSEAVCANKVKVIRCPTKSRILILGANYGRLQGGQCTNKHFPQQTCRSRYSARVYRWCNKKQACRVAASPRYFGNVCPTLSPFLEIKYRCEPGYNTVVICENKARRITCQGSQYRIHIYRAEYGRRNTRLCPGPNQRNYRCIGNPNLVTSKLRVQCEDQGSCYLWASNLLYGDPCRTTYKYLAVTYRCH